MAAVNVKRIRLAAHLCDDNTTCMTFHSCCGKRICDGCAYAMVESGANDLCAYCRTPPVESEEEEVNRVKKLMEKGNALAFHVLAGHYRDGRFATRLGKG